ncbi:Protein kinase byr2 [Zancudomyces culisetae]|uniref:mitogen-activated protein kinase kinase kinase n=1 Tax=Zancudomyces culisetae TaxID=1213189 RepID=A0A1R1PVS7_ZANCU|nr:Protein kinase byr2 [Zancudomyces culisetae]|eukprot:OMH85002.1 Protein kinase byr2 [Zancudomyces culisetae]
MQCIGEMQQQEPLSQVLNWNRYQVAKWLETEGFGNYVDTFVDNNIDGEQLLDMSYSLLGDLNIPKVGDKIKLNKKISKLRDGGLESELRIWKENKKDVLNESIGREDNLVCGKDENYRENRTVGSQELVIDRKVEQEKPTNTSRTMMTWDRQIEEVIEANAKKREITVVGPENEQKKVEITGEILGEKVMEKVLREFGISERPDKEKYSLFLLTAEQGARMLNEEDLEDILLQKTAYNNEKFYLKKRHQRSIEADQASRDANLLRAIEKFENMFADGTKKNGTDMFLGSNDSLKTIQSQRSQQSASPIRTGIKHNFFGGSSNKNVTAAKGNNHEKSKKNIRKEFEAMKVKAERQRQEFGSQPSFGYLRNNLSNYFPDNESAAKKSIEKAMRNGGSVDRITGFKKNTSKTKAVGRPAPLILANIPFKMSNENLNSSRSFKSDKSKRIEKFKKILGEENIDYTFTKRIPHPDPADNSEPELEENDYGSLLSDLSDSMFDKSIGSSSRIFENRSTSTHSFSKDNIQKCLNSPDVEHDKFPINGSYYDTSSCGDRNCLEFAESDYTSSLDFYFNERRSPHGSGSITHPKSPLALQGSINTPQRSPELVVRSDTSLAKGSLHLSSDTILLNVHQPRQSVLQDLSLNPEKSDESKASTEQVWIKGAKIASGSFGSVYYGIHVKTGVIMAVKQVDFPMAGLATGTRKHKMVSALQSELRLLQTLKHKNIVRYLGYESVDDQLNIFLEYVPGGSVTSALATFGAFPESLARSYIKQTLEGLSYLHGKNIIHCDIKGGNVLIDHQGRIKISDFGISKTVDDVMNSSKNRASLQGSIFWMAPEVVRDLNYTMKCDIWSLGCLLIEMLTGAHPFPGLDQFQALLKIGQYVKPELPSVARSVPENGIGIKGNDLPWNIPQEMKYFTQLTTQIRRKEQQQDGIATGSTRDVSTEIPSAGYMNVKDMQDGSDLQRKEINVVIMGRNTWTSIPDKYRPLNKRFNIVVTRDAGLFGEKKYKGSVIQPSLRASLEYVYKNEHPEYSFCDVFVVGGTQMYHEALNMKVGAEETDHSSDIAGGFDGVGAIRAFVTNVKILNSELKPEFAVFFPEIPSGFEKKSFEYLQGLVPFDIEEMMTASTSNANKNAQNSNSNSNSNSNNDKDKSVVVNKTKSANAIEKSFTIEENYEVEFAVYEKTR